MQCFRDDARGLGFGLRVLATDLNPALSPASQAADAAFVMPRYSAPDFVPELLALCRREKVDLIVPTIDPELAVLSQSRREFAEIGTRVLVSAPEIVGLSNDKEATAMRLRTLGIPTPATLSLCDYRAAPGTLRWPLIVKPRAGSASIGVVRPTSPEQIMSLPAGRDLIVQELWQGREYTVNIFFDADGCLQCAVPHLRLETRSGEVSKGRTEDIKSLRAAARALEKGLAGASGPLCFQAIVTEGGDFAVFEINARFGGGYPLAHRAGAKFSRWVLEELAGLPCSAHDEWRPNVLMLRYDAAIFVDE